MAQEFEYQEVGKDEQGNSLFKRVEVTITDNKIPKRNKSTVSKNQNDCLYADLDPELVKLRHCQSEEAFKGVSFGDREFVVKVINRHVIGIIAIWLMSIIIMVLLLFIGTSFAYSDNGISDIFKKDGQVSSLAILFLASIVVLSLLFGLVATKVFMANRLIVTTERVVQHISNGLFDYKQQTIDISWIEDVSYHQTGIMAMIFNYGSLRLSTIGDESTYYFSLTPNPKQTVAKLNELVLAVKNNEPLPKFN